MITDNKEDVLCSEMQSHDEVTVFLGNYRESVPAWLEGYRKNDEIRIPEILNSSRVVYYPGAFLDGQPVMTCNTAHYAHIYIYADYMMKKEWLDEDLKIRGFMGYHLLDSRDLTEEDLCIASWERHFVHDVHETGFGRPFWARIMIFERDEEYDDSHGSKRFAFIYVCMDGIALYDALFACRKSRLDLLLLQDHGLGGGNYNRFGRGGYMEEAAACTGVFPELILATEGDSTRVWHDYEKISEMAPVIGGMHSNERYLYSYIKKKVKHKVSDTQHHNLK